MENEGRVRWLFVGFTDSGGLSCKLSHIRSNLSVQMCFAFDHRKIVGLHVMKWRNRDFRNKAQTLGKKDTIRVAFEFFLPRPRCFMLNTFYLNFFLTFTGLDKGMSYNILLLNPIIDWAKVTKKYLEYGGKLSYRDFFAPVDEWFFLVHPVCTLWSYF